MIRLLVLLLSIIFISSGTYGGSTPTPISTPTVTRAPTSTPIPTATATPSPTPTPVSVRTTFYGEAFRGGPFYCEEYGYYDPDDPSTVASGDGGPSCGTHLHLCSESTCISVTVKDRCGGCSASHLDLSRAGWEALGKPTDVRMTVIP